MIEIFTSTTSHLSNEFVESFQAEKLALNLFKIGQETGVKFNRQKKSISIAGHWNALLKAHKELGQLYDNETFQNVARNEEENDPQPIEAQKVETPNWRKAKKRPLLASKDGKPGRKPGASVLNSISLTGVPEPVIVYQYNKSSIVTQEFLRPSNLLNAFDSDAKQSSDQNDAEVIDTAEENQDGEETDAITTVNSHNESSENLEGHAHDATDNNFETCDDSATDIDENYITNENTEKEPKSLETPKDSNDLELKINEEKSEEVKSLPQQRKKARKSKPVRVVQRRTTPTKSKSKSKQKDDNEGEGEFKCDLCSYTGNKQSNLKEHKKRKHRNKFTCNLCQKQFGFNKDLNRHKSQVHAEPTHFCDICQKFYKSKRVYDEHILTHYDSYIKPTYSCKLCPKSFSTKYVLATHIKTEHLGMKKSFVCPTCGRSFTQKNSYIMHANVHAGIKPYVCDVCGKAFTYDKSLREHKFMHDTIRRFQCHICSKTFRQTTSLRIHMKVHKDTKDYMCTACGKGFTQKQALLRHERIHSGDKPYVCGLCGRSFSDYSIIRRHMMLIHKKDSKDWREDIISNIKKKKDYYIEGGPGHHVRELKTTDNEAMLIKGKRSHPVPAAEQLSDQIDFSTSSIQDLSQSHVTLLPLLYDTAAASAGTMMQHGTGSGSQTTNPSTVRHSATNMPINYSLTSAYSSGTTEISSQNEIQESNLSEVTGPFHNAQRSHSRQWLNPSSTISAVSTASSLPEQMRGQLTLPSGSGLSGDTTHPQLLHPWAYGGYGPYCGPSNLPQYPRNSQS